MRLDKAFQSSMPRNSIHTTVADAVDTAPREHPCDLHTLNIVQVEHCMAQTRGQEQTLLGMRIGFHIAVIIKVVA